MHIFTFKSPKTLKLPYITPPESAIFLQDPSGLIHPAPVSRTSHSNSNTNPNRTRVEISSTPRRYPSSPTLEMMVRTGQNGTVYHEMFGQESVIEDEQDSGAEGSAICTTREQDFAVGQGGVGMGRGHT